ncbi:MAG: amidohydrolase family protein [Dehalococcoidia bacterium]|nr:amidohydrolase family protein [Dehalococcoidia bacterium]
MPGAIAILSSVPAARETRERVAQAHEGELECRVTKATRAAGPPSTLEDKIRVMDEAGVDKAICTVYKMYSYHNRRMLSEGSIDELAKAVGKYPTRLVGMTGYNPYRIKESLQDVKRSVRDYNFKGVHIHIYGFDMYLTDARMYPLYALCEELQVPVSMQVGHVLEAMPSKYGHPMQLDDIILHFPALKLIGLHTGYPYSDVLISCCTKWDNIYFGLTSWLPRYVAPSIVTFMNGQGREQCMWGGAPSRIAFEQIDQLGLKPDVKENLLWKTAAKVYNLDAD